MGIEILLIDDDESVLEILDLLLSGNGYSTTTCTSGAIAISELDFTKFDVVLSDYQMPVLNGVEVAEHLHRTLKNPPKFLLMSGCLDTCARHSSNSLLINVFSKPLHFKTLLESLDNLKL